jgi:quercetin dioxygenase-like cupin family protein
MGSIHKFSGDDARFDWQGVSEQAYDSAEVRGVSVRWLIGGAGGAPHFAVRFFEIEPGECTSLDRHEHDHGVVVLRGRGQVLLGEEVTELSYGDVVYVSPNELHQFRCVGGEPFGFLCVIPAPGSVGP